MTPLMRTKWNITLDEILLAFSRCAGFPESVRIEDVKNRIRQDRLLSFDSKEQLNRFQNTVQGTMERSAPNRRYSHPPYYFYGIRRAVYRLLEDGHAHLNSLNAGKVKEQQLREQREKKLREAENRAFLQNKNQSATLPEVVEINGRRVVRDTLTVTSLKEIYGNTCQICGCAIATFESVYDDNRGYAEVHHIRPLGSGHQGPDYPANMLVLCPNHHAYFDLCTMALDPASLEVYCLELDGEVHRKGILFWVESGHEFDPDCLTYAWDLFRRKLVEHRVDISEAKSD